MNDFTYGSSKAAVTLARILENEPKYQSKVSALIHGYFRTIKIIEKISVKPVREMLLRMYFERCKTTIDGADWPANIISYAINVLNARANIAREKYEINSL